MRVYAVSQGSYSYQYYGPVFSSRELAEKYVLHRCPWWVEDEFTDEYAIEDWEVDDEFDDSEPLYPADYVDKKITEARRKREHQYRLPIGPNPDLEIEVPVSGLRVRDQYGTWQTLKVPIGTITEQAVSTKD